MTKMPKTPVFLMVSGGSDSMALLELAHAYVHGFGEDDLLDMLAAALPAPDMCALHVLHVNHLLRGEASDNDEAFVREACERLGVPFEVERTDIAALSREQTGGMEAIARTERYRLAHAALERAQMLEHAGEGGLICTAHTLDDRLETFYMRSLVGTGPGGFASIPRARGNIRRPLLDATREQLRNWLRDRYAGTSDDRLWREDETNESGENFRSRVRMDLMPVLRGLRPGFESVLAQTMDLISDENEQLQNEVDAFIYRFLNWNGERAELSVQDLAREPVFLQRRILRDVLLVVHPDARLEARQIDRILAHMREKGFATEVSGGLRVVSDGRQLAIHKAQ